MLNLFALLPLKPLSGFNEGITANPGSDVANRFADTISNIVTLLTFFAGLAFLIWFIIGALTWITSVDHADKLEKAKNQMSSAIIGLVIVVLAIAIVSLLGKITGFDILDPAAIISRIIPD
ncbi:MAG: hypothetical protein V1810_00815 [Candidatus Beckwithbacteria bacterium]